VQLVIKVLKHGEFWPLGALLTARAANAGYEAVHVTAESTSQESGWIRRAQTGDSAAFEELYRTHVDKVYGLCLRMTGNVAEAQDSAQDAFIQAWSKLNHFRGESAFSTWLHRVAVNTVLGRMRKSRREQDRIRAVSDVASTPESIGDSGGLRDLEQAIDELPSGARHVFVLHAVYGYSHNETGDMLGIAAGTSKAQLHRARRLLAQQLKTECA
jgi:RNA polymerase sigma-70 factor (ECF subfamily)